VCHSAIDATFFGPTVDRFEPDRWLDPQLNNAGLSYFSYGIGPRICPAWSITNRMMYGLLLRMITAFEIKIDPTDPPPTSWRTFGATPSGVLNAPKAFKVRFVPRNEERLRQEVEAMKRKMAAD
jgi:phenylacetate 2-hydroxylase